MYRPVRKRPSRSFGWGDEDRDAQCGQVVVVCANNAGALTRLPFPDAL